MSLRRKLPANPLSRIANLVFGALPPFSGKQRMIHAAAAISRLSGDEQICSPFPGTNLAVDLGQRIERLMWAGAYEPHVTHCMRALLEPGDAVLDIGANMGYHSVFAASRVGPEGFVAAFEADPAVFRLLERNLEPFPQARAIHSAVSDRDGQAMFERSSTPGESGWGTLTAVRDLGTGEHVAVPAVSLDAWVRQNHLSSLRFIKMDIEGSELAMLRGSKSLFARFRPLLLLEINDAHLRNAGGSAAQLGENVQSMGYRLFRLSYRRIASLDSLAGCSFDDCLCVPEESLADILERLRTHGFRL